MAKWLPVRWVPMKLKQRDGTIIDSRIYLESLGFKVRKSPKGDTYVVSGRDDFRELTHGTFRGVEVEPDTLVFIVHEKEGVIHPIIWSGLTSSPAEHPE